jgi:3-hydroxypropanoate dehydrogenase
MNEVRDLPDGSLGDLAHDQLFRSARTQNAWLDRPVPDRLLEQAVDLAKMGPTSANCSPMRIVFVRSSGGKEALKDALLPQNVEKTMTAPVTAIIGHDLDFPETLPVLFPHTDARAWFAGNDTLVHDTAFRNGTLSAGYLILALRSLGLDSGAMSGFDPEKINQTFFGGTRVRVNFLLNIGYGDDTKVFARLPRLPFDQIAHFA